MAADQYDELREKIERTDDPATKLSYIHEYTPLLTRRDLQQALALAEEGLVIARAIHDPKLIARSCLDIGDCHQLMGRFNTAFRYLARGARLCREAGCDPATVSVGAFRIARIFQARGEFRKALTYLDHAYQASHSVDNRELMMRALGTMGDIYRLLGDYSKAIDILSKSLRLAVSSGNHIGAAVAYNNIAIVHCCLFDTGNALKSYMLSVEHYRAAADRGGEAIALMNLGFVYATNGDVERGFEHLFEALTIHRELGQKRNIAGVLNQIGEAYYRLGDPPRALPYLQEAVELYQAIQYRQGESEALNVTGQIYHALGRPDEAISCYESSLEIAREIDDRLAEGRVSQNLAAILEQKGEYARAIEHYRCTMAVNWELAAQDTRRMVAAMQVRLDMEKSEREREILRLKAEHLEHDMEAKARELTAMALHLAQKSEMIESLRKEISQLAGTSDARDLAHKLMSHLNDDQRAEDEWGAFETRFNQIHPGFVRTLVERYPDLTPTEVRVCSLLQTNISSKEIASLLNTTVRTVEKHRQHIRKKLRLENEDNLIMFLAVLS